MWEDANQERWTGEQKADYYKTLMNTRVSNLPWIKTGTGLVKNPRGFQNTEKNGRKKGMAAEREILREYAQRGQGHQTMEVKRKQELKGKDHDEG